MLACLLGPSGCGKTTILRAIAGFQPLQKGAIFLNEAVLSEVGFTVPPEKRSLGMVFQDYALFPHLTIGQNVAAGIRRYSKARKAEVVGQMLEYVGLLGYESRYPHELSGGQQQRVALARALAPNPKLLLMDEPFSNLDLEMRTKLATETRDLLKETGTTCVLVTHDQQDAFVFSDQIGVMREGGFEQWDNPYDLYHKPATTFVAQFVGEGVFLPGQIMDERTIETELATIRGAFPSRFTQGDQVRLLVRPDDIIHDDLSQATARIIQRSFRGESYLYTLELPSGQQVLSLVPSHHNHQVGEDLGIKVEVDHLVCFPQKPD